jgi:hypothetical protein
MDATTTIATITTPPFIGLRWRHYGAIAADPASHFSSYTAIQSQNWSSRRDNEKHYQTMSFEQLAALPVADLAAPICPGRALLRRALRGPICA